jgi:hypothetical protein
MPRRARIEASARQAFPGLRYRRCQTRQGPIHTYELVLEVPGYESRRVWVEFVPPLSNSPRIYADGPSGPETSPHRFSERRWTRLCVWYPGDPLERRWVPDDGLLMLFGMIATHLLKEAWWRESGEWLGEEAPHGVLTEEDDFTAKDIA